MSTYHFYHSYISHNSSIPPSGYRQTSKWPLLNCRHPLSERVPCPTLSQAKKTQFRPTSHPQHRPDQRGSPGREAIPHGARHLSEIQIVHHFYTWHWSRLYDIAQNPDQKYTNIQKPESIISKLMPFKYQTQYWPVTRWIQTLEDWMKLCFTKSTKSKLQHIY